MPKLNEQQLKKRGIILQSMFDSFYESHRWLDKSEAEYQFTTEIANDPVKLRIINALAASTEEDHGVQTKKKGDIPLS